nr:hypothetical protein B0A51_08988 [Rachicladosporium sp. CCFEE 5018]
MSAQVLPLDFILSPDIVLCTEDIHPGCFVEGGHRHIRVGTGYKSTAPVVGQYDGKIIELSFDKNFWTHIPCLHEQHFVYPGGILIDTDLYDALLNELWKHVTGLRFQDIDEGLAEFDELPARYNFIELQEAGFVEIMVDAPPRAGAEEQDDEDDCQSESEEDGTGAGDVDHSELNMDGEMEVDMADINKL